MIIDHEGYSQPRELSSCFLGVDEEKMNSSFRFWVVSFCSHFCEESTQPPLRSLDGGSKECRCWIELPVLRVSVGLFQAILASIDERSAFTTDIAVTCRVNQDGQERLDCPGQQVQR